MSGVEGFSQPRGFDAPDESAEELVDLVRNSISEEALSSQDLGI